MSGEPEPDLTVCACCLGDGFACGEPDGHLACGNCGGTGIVEVEAASWHSPTTT